MPAKRAQCFLGLSVEGAKTGRILAEEEQLGQTIPLAIVPEPAHTGKAGLSSSFPTNICRSRFGSEYV